MRNKSRNLFIELIILEFIYFLMDLGTAVV